MTFQVRVNATVETFDVEGYESSLRAILLVGPETEIVTVVTAGSVLIRSEVVTTNSTLATGMLESMLSLGDAEMDELAGAPAQWAVSPQVESFLEYSPPPPPSPPVPPPLVPLMTAVPANAIVGDDSGFTLDWRNMLLTAAVIVPIIVLCVVVILIYRSRQGHAVEPQSKGAHLGVRDVSTASPTVRLQSRETLGLMPPSLVARAHRNAPVLPQMHSRAAPQLQASAGRQVESWSLKGDDNGSSTRNQVRVTPHLPSARACSLARPQPWTQSALGPLASQPPSYPVLPPIPRLDALAQGSALRTIRDPKTRTVQIDPP